MKKLCNIAKEKSNNNRLKKYNLFIKYFSPLESHKILDIGPTEKEYHESDNLLEKKYPFPEKITALGINEFKEFCIRYPKVKAVNYNGDDFPFKENEFDFCWSNAVLEHVGDVQKQTKFLREIKRVSKKAFVATPNKYFPIEVHTKIPFIHFLPKALFDKFLCLIGKAWAAGQYMNLLNLREIRLLLERCGINEYKIIKNKISGFTVDFIIIF